MSERLTDDELREYNGWADGWVRELRERHASKGERALAREIDIAMLSHANSPVLPLAMENPEIDPSEVSQFIARALIAKYRIALKDKP